MGPLERFYLALMSREPDQVPICVGGTAAEYVEFSGITFLEYYFKPEKALYAQLSYLERFRRKIHLLYGICPDMVQVGLYVIPSAFGCKIVFKETQPSRAVPIIKEPDDIPCLVRDAGVPDLRKDGYCSQGIEQLRWWTENVPPDLREYYGYFDNYTIIVGVGDLSAILLGQENFLIGLKLYPEEMHRWLRIMAEAAVEWIKIQEEITGKTKKLFISDHQNGMMSRKDFAEFIVPYEREIIRSCPDSIVIHHSETDVTGNPGVVDEMIEIGIDVWHMCPEMDIGLAKEMFGDRVCLWGNMDAVPVFAKGNPKSVKDACRNIIQKAADGGGLLLGNSGAMTSGGRYENIDAMIDAVEKYGKYPIDH